MNKIWTKEDETQLQHLQEQKKQWEYFGGLRGLTGALASSIEEAPEGVTFIGWSTKGDITSIEIILDGQASLLFHQKIAADDNIKKG